MFSTEFWALLRRRIAPCRFLSKPDWKKFLLTAVSLAFSLEGALGPRRLGRGGENSRGTYDCKGRETRRFEAGEVAATRCCFREAISGPEEFCGSGEGRLPSRGCGGGRTVAGATGFGHVAGPRARNAAAGHGGAFVTPPGGGAQNGSGEKMWRREKCETKGEAPPQRERRPAGSARAAAPPPVVAGSSSLFFFFLLYNFATGIGSPSAGSPSRWVS